MEINLRAEGHCSEASKGGTSDVCRGICDQPGVIDQLGASCKGIGHTAPCNQGSSHRPDLGWALGVLHGAVLRRLSQFDPDSGAVCDLPQHEWNDTRGKS